MTTARSQKRPTCREESMSDNVALSDIDDIIDGMADVARVSRLESPQKGSAGVDFRAERLDGVRV
jgi:hypothetical protein